MKRVVFFLALILLIPSTVLSAQKISVSAPGVESKNTPEILVLPAGLKELETSLNLTPDKKTKLEFTWTAPDGKIVFRDLKIIFPVKGKASLFVKDTVETPSEAGWMPGWWTVEVSINGEKLSQRFLLTDSRQILNIYGGKKEEKMEVLFNLDLHGVEAEEILNIAVLDPDDEVRAAAARSVKEDGQAWKRNILLRLLDDKAVPVRQAALKSIILAGIADKNIIEKAGSDPSYEVKIALAEYLSPKDEGSFKAFGSLIKDSVPEVRESALMTLKKAHGPGALKALAEGFKTRDRHLKKDIINAISSENPKGKIDYLLPALSDPDPEIRALGIKAVGLDGQKYWTELVDDPDADVALTALQLSIKYADFETLNKAVLSKHPEVQKGAVEALAGLKDERAAEGLLLAWSNGDKELKLLAINGLKTAGKAGVAGLVKVLSDKEPEIRMQALSSLMTLAPDEAKEGILKAVLDPDAAIRKKAMQYFIGQGGESLPGVLGKFACDPDAGIRNLALSSLALLKGNDAEKAVSSFFACGGPEQRMKVIEILSGNESDTATETMLRAVKDESPAVRIKAAKNLLSLGMTAPLKNLIKEDDPELKEIGLAALEKSPEPGMFPELAEIAKNGEMKFRLMALRALFSLNSKEADSVIAGMASDASKEVREFARSAALSRGGLIFLDVLYRVYSDGGGEKAKAFEAIKKIQGPEADEAIYKIFSQEKGDAKANAFEALLERKSAGADKGFKDLLYSDDSKLRVLAVNRLKNFPGNEEIYLYAADSPYSDVRAATADYICSGKGPIFTEKLLKLLSDPVPALRKKSLYCLSNPLNDALLDALPKLVRDEDPEVRSASLREVLLLPASKARTDALLSAASGNDAEAARLAADALLDVNDPRALPVFDKFFRKGYRRNEFLAAMGKIEDPGALEYMKKIFNDTDEPGVRIFVIHALEAKDIKAAGPVLMQASKDGSASVRMEAIGGLIRFQVPGREPVLASALSDPAPEIKRTAFLECKKMDGEGIFTAMLPLLSDDYLKESVFNEIERRLNDKNALELADFASRMDNKSDRLRALEILDRNNASYACFLKFMDDKEIDIRRRCAEALGKRKGPEPVYALLLMAKEDDPEIREAAGRNISTQGNEVLMQGVREIFKNSKASPAAVALSIGTLNNPEYIDETLKLSEADPALFSAVLKILKDRHAQYDLKASLDAAPLLDSKGRVELSGSIALADGPGAEAAAKSLFDKYPETRTVFLKAARKYSKAGAESMTLAAADDPDEAVRMQAAVSASELGHEKTLLKLYKDSSAAVRKESVTGLEAIGSPEAVNALYELASSKNDLAAQAVQSLINLGGKLSLARWRELAGNASAPQASRLAAMGIVAREGGQAAVFMAGLLSDSDSGISEAALSALKDMKEKALPALYTLLGDARFKNTALELVLDSADSSSENPLISALDGLGEMEKARVAKTLGRIGGKKSVHALFKLYQDKDPVIQAAVTTAVGGLKISGDEQEALAILEGSLNSGRDSIRFVAARSAGELKAKKLSPDIEKAISKENSYLVKDEMDRALKEISGEPKEKASSSP